MPPTPFRVPDQVPKRIDWQTERERFDLADVIGQETGQRPVMRNGRAWFVCAFHEDGRPSLVVRKSKDGRPYFRCYGCDARGGVADFIMRLRSMTFPEAIAYLTGATHQGKSRRTDGTEPQAAQGVRSRPTAPVGDFKGEIKADPTGLPESDALALVEDAEAALCSPEGSDALAYLSGPERCLSAATIRSARLGWTPGTMVPTRDGDRAFHASGIAIPWFAGDRLALVKLRQPPGRKPKYAEAFRDPARLVCFPGPETIRPGRPLVVVEGEFDALLLGQELAEMAAVLTLGSASARPDGRALRAMQAASPWYIATDADAAGDKSADAWPARARRVRPPSPFKDWCEAKTAGVDLNRWWRDILTGVDRPPLFSWPELSGWRWGGADEAPGIDRYPPGVTP